MKVKHGGFWFFLGCALFVFALGLPNYLGDVVPGRSDDGKEASGGKDAPALIETPSADDAAGCCLEVCSEPAASPVTVEIDGRLIRFPVHPKVGDVLKVEGELYRVLELGVPWKLERIQDSKPASVRFSEPGDRIISLNSRGHVRPRYGRWDYPRDPQRPELSIQLHLTRPPHNYDYNWAMKLRRRDAELIHDSWHNRHSA